MIEQEMTFEEIRANRERFLSLYHVADKFTESGISWDELLEIGADFEKKRSEDGEYYKTIQRYIAQISGFEYVHTYRSRIKKTGSLLAKILRKSKSSTRNINIGNYFREISDLLGIRILYVFKADYWPIHLQIMNAYGNQLTEDIRLKLKKGDDEKMYQELLDNYNNVHPDYDETYRSIHYTINADINNINKSPRLEIQTRTIFEEGWSEINHKLVYKKGTCIAPGLSKTSSALSELVGTCDLIGGLMKDLHDTGLTAVSDSENERLGIAIRKFLES